MTKKYIFSMLKRNDKSIFNVSSIRIKRPALHSILFPLLSLLIISIIISPAASSSLNLSAPTFMDVSGQDAFEILFASSVDAVGLSAGLLMPNGLQYAGNARIELNGRQQSKEPSLDRGWLRWDLADELSSFRHIVINEFETKNTSNYQAEPTRAAQLSMKN